MSVKIRVGVAIWEEGASEPPRVSSFTKGLLSLVARWVGGWMVGDAIMNMATRIPTFHQAIMLLSTCLHIIAVHYNYSSQDIKISYNWFGELI